MSDICFFGETYYRGNPKKFGIKTDDRRRHMYVIGKTGMGKTTMLENMVYSDVINGHGLCYIDPHGDTAEKILDFIPANRINDVIYFNPADIDYPISFNVLESVEPAYKHLVASGMVGVFKKIWADSWGPRLEYILRNALLALLDHPDSTLLGVTRILVDGAFRKKVVSNIKDPVVKSFWLDEFTKFNDRTLAEVISPIQNKVGQFLSTALIRNIVGQVKTAITFREIMDNKKILILNLSKGRIGEDSSALLGAMMITKIQLAAMSRVDTPEEKRPDFYLYVDEFQNFATESFAGILSEARKYRLNLVVAHQYITQLDEKVSDAVFGNVGTIITFRVGANDAETLVKEFAPFFNEEDFVNLPKFFIYLKLMIDGISSNPFSAKTLPPLSKYEGNNDKIIKVTRERYAKKREIVEEKIMRWSGHGSSILNEDDEKNIKQIPQRQEKNNEKQFYNENKVQDFSQNKKQKYTYKCNDCQNEFSLNVKLDPTKPLYCKECLPKHKSTDVKPTNSPSTSFGEVNNRVVDQKNNYNSLIKTNQKIQPKLERPVLKLSDLEKLNKEKIDFTKKQNHQVSVNKNNLSQFANANSNNVIVGKTINQNSDNQLNKPTINNGTIKNNNSPSSLGKLKTDKANQQFIKPGQIIKL